MDRVYTHCAQSCCCWWSFLEHNFQHHNLRLHYLERCPVPSIIGALSYFHHLLWRKLVDEDKLKSAIPTANHKCLVTRPNKLRSAESIIPMTNHKTQQQVFHKICRTVRARGISGQLLLVVSIRRAMVYKFCTCNFLVFWEWAEGTSQQTVGTRVLL